MEIFMAKHVLPPADKGKKYIFRPYRWDPRKGRYVHASEHGLKAWPILVDA
jgi:hypothetical protein